MKPITLKGSISNANVNDYGVCEIEIDLGQDWPGHFSFRFLDKNGKTNTEGQRQLSAICHAAGVMKPKTIEDLIDKPLTVRVIQPDTDTGILPPYVVIGIA